MLFIYAMFDIMQTIINSHKKERVL